MRSPPRRLLLLLLLASCKAPPPLAAADAAPATLPAANATTAPSPAAAAPASARASLPAPAPGELDLPRFINAPDSTLQAAATAALKLAPDASLRDAGLERYAEHGIVSTIFVHLMPEKPGGPVYRGPLFAGITREMDHAAVERLLGAPDETRAADADRTVPSWIKYRRQEAQLHFQFRPDGRIEMITLMNPDWRPGTTRYPGVP